MNGGNARHSVEADEEKDFRGISWGRETRMEWAWGAEGRTKALRTLATGVSLLFPIF